MSTAGGRKLRTWLRKQLFTERKQGPCVKVVLHHMGTSGKLGPPIVTLNIGEGKVPGEPLNDDDLSIYAGELEEGACDYAEGVGMTQTFICASYYEEDPEQALGRHAFSIKIDREEEEDTEALSEPANTAGLVKQQMRHNEGLMRLFVASTGTLMHTLQKQNEMLATQVQKLFDDKVEGLDAMEALVSSKHEREIQLRITDQKAEHKNQILQNLLALLPAVGNKIIGRKILPETTDTIQLQIVRFVEALTQQDAERIFAALNDPQKQIAWSELLGLIAKQAEKDNDSNGSTETSNPKAS